MGLEGRKWIGIGSSEVVCVRGIERIGRIM